MRIIDSSTTSAYYYCSGLSLTLFTFVSSGPFKGTLETNGRFHFLRFLWRDAWRCPVWFSLGGAGSLGWTFAGSGLKLVIFLNYTYSLMPTSWSFSALSTVRSYFYALPVSGSSSPGWFLVYFLFHLCRFLSFFKGLQVFYRGSLSLGKNKVFHWVLFGFPFILRWLSPGYWYFL